ncbi:hypothetical protein [Streptococcus uberis]|uniref:hypothetical protein n=1 Tax=Streptococcus uberis TaxID=1349 RepID=UPI001FF3A9AC|nr:hypothetical protein [Streptococcus uberis]MCK1222608.1 hypothetical protein [Streptococcus uberis]
MMKNTFKNIFFWLFIFTLIASSVLFYSLSKKNNEIENYKSINRKTYAYITQLDGSNFRDNVLDFVMHEDKTVLKTNEWSSYKNGQSEADIRIIYKKFDKSGMVATNFDLTKSEPYLVGIEVKNKGENDISINAKEFFVRNNEDYYLPFDSSINTSIDKTNENVTIEKGKTVNIMAIYEFYKSESKKGLSVRYGGTTWK